MGNDVLLRPFGHFWGVFIMFFGFSLVFWFLLFLVLLCFSLVFFFVLIFLKDLPLQFSLRCLVSGGWRGPAFERIGWFLRETRV